MFQTTLFSQMKNFSTLLFLFVVSACFILVLDWIATNDANLVAKLLLKQCYISRQGYIAVRWYSFAFASLQLALKFAGVILINFNLMIDVILINLLWTRSNQNLTSSRICENFQSVATLPAVA